MTTLYYRVSSHLHVLYTWLHEWVGHCVNLWSISFVAGAKVWVCYIVPNDTGTPDVSHYTTTQYTLPCACKAVSKCHDSK